MPKIRVGQASTTKKLSCLHLSTIWNVQFRPKFDIKKLVILFCEGALNRFFCIEPK